MVMRLLMAPIAAMVAISPVLAQPIVVTGHQTTFRDLEFDYSGEDRVAAARSMLAGAIPAGSSVVNARALLKKAGARCTDAAPDRLRCTSNSFETVEDMLHDVTWTIAVDHRGDSVTNLAVDRQSIGS